MHPRRKVSPVHPPAAYIGGKKQLAAQIVDLIDAVDHATYAEPFIGMGGVFLRRRTAPQAEVVNDLSGDVATFFRVLQRHYEPFMDLLRWRFTGREEFARLMRVDPTTLTDLERAVRFLYLQRLTFGGKVKGRSFGVSAHTPGRFDVTKLGPLLTDLNERLAGVIVENLPYDQFIARYDSADTLFYLDPPYFGSEDDYGVGAFTRQDFARLATALGSIAGQFLLSLNDAPEVRRIFAAFPMQEVEITYSISDGPPQPVRELIIQSPDLRLRPKDQMQMF